jgi:hypothetical protein
MPLPMPGQPGAPQIPSGAVPIGGGPVPEISPPSCGACKAKPLTFAFAGIQVVLGTDPVQLVACHCAACGAVFGTFPKPEEKRIKLG